MAAVSARLLSLPSWAVVLLLFAVPLLYLAATSIGTFDYDTGQISWGFTFENYAQMLSGTTAIAFVNSIELALEATVLCILIGFPIAYGMAIAPGRLQTVLLVAVIVPFWTSFVVRVYAWITLLSPHSVVPVGLSLFGLAEPGDDLNYTSSAVLIGLVYSYLPLAVLPMFVALSQQDRNLVVAAQDLGCSRLVAFWRVTFPLSLPGVAASALLVGVPSLGEYTIPAVLGGGKTLMVGNIVTAQFTVLGNFSQGAAIAFVLLATIAVVLLVPRLAYLLAQRIRRGAPTGTGA
jgi:ABC-type spermidine/putrescine transport system permease subunit I